MPAFWRALLEEQQHSGFADFAGGRATVRLPISDRLLGSLIRERLPADWPVRDFELQALAGDQITLRVKLTRPAILPALQLQLYIVRQPHWPHSPVLILRLGATGLSAFAGPALSLLNALPRGIHRDGDRLLVDLRRLAEAHGYAHLLGFITSLEVHTDPGRVLLSASGAVPPLSPAEG